MSLGAEKVATSMAPVSPGNKISGLAIEPNSLDKTMKLAATIDAIWASQASTADTMAADSPQKSDGHQDALFRSQLRQDILTELHKDLNYNFVRLQENLDETLAQCLRQFQKNTDPEPKVADLEARMVQRFVGLETVVASGLEDIRRTKKSLEELADGLEAGLAEDMVALKAELGYLRETTQCRIEGPANMSLELTEATVLRKTMQDAFAKYAGQLHQISAVQKDMSNSIEIQETKRINFEAQLSRKLSDLETFVAKTCGTEKQRLLTNSAPEALWRQDERRAGPIAHEPKTTTEHSDSSSTQLPSDASDGMSSVEERLQILETSAKIASPGRLEDIFDMTKDMMKSTLELGKRVQAEVATLKSSNSRKGPDNADCPVIQESTQARHRQQANCGKEGNHLATKSNARSQTRSDSMHMSQSRLGHAPGKSPETLQRFSDQLASSGRSHRQPVVDQHTSPAGSRQQSLASRQQSCFAGMPLSQERASQIAPRQSRSPNPPPH